MTAVQCPPVVVPGDTWHTDPGPGLPLGHDPESDVAEFDEAIAIATTHTKSAIYRLRRAAHALPMATHEPEREAMMATIGRLHGILADLEGAAP